jgi:ubiquinone/menaquinone biosynthesis C-methylase UbiE
MGEIEAKVTAHYTPGDLHGRILGELRAAGLDVDALRPEDLKPVESLHVGGWQATEHVIERLGVARGARVLDVGCGIGGTARTLAVQRGASVTGVDLTPAFVAAAADLSRRAGVAGVEFIEANATALPFEDASFDAATMLHVGMNVADKPALFREVARVLRPGGGFAVYDVMRVGPGDLAFPMPWIADPAASFVAKPQDYAAAAEAAGFREEAREDRRAGAVESVEQQRARVAGTPMEPRFVNAIAALGQGTLAPVLMILRRE